MCFFCCLFFFFFKQKTAYEMRISDWSSDVCSSDLHPMQALGRTQCRIRGDAADRVRQDAQGFQVKIEEDIGFGAIIMVDSPLGRAEPVGDVIDRSGRISALVENGCRCMDRKSTRLNSSH